MKNQNDSNTLPAKKAYQNEILEGLTRTRKKISPKFLYDERGSELFEEICKLKEYYPVHAEKEILRKNAKSISKALGKNVLLIEPGCGACVKVKHLLSALDDPHAYVAMDISDEFLKKTVEGVRNEFKNIPIFSLAGDYTRSLMLPKGLQSSPAKRVIFFPGSTIGNMHRSEAKALLKRMGSLVKKGGGLLIGVDLKKEAKTLELAYDDPKGVTAEFNYNLLDRLNRDFKAGFNRNHFQYEARYNSKMGRVEMFLVSQSPQTVHLGNQKIHLKEKESIHTEDSYKYSVSEFTELALEAGFLKKKIWQDSRKLFCVYYLEKI